MTDVKSQSDRWLQDNGPPFLQLLLQAITLKPSPGVITDHAPNDTEAEKQQVYPNALCLLDDKGRVALWCSGAPKMYGYTPEEVRGRHFSDFDGATKSPHTWSDLDQAESTGHLCLECWQQRKDGSTFWANIVTVSLRNDAGELKGFAGVIRDFSQRHEKDQRLQRSLVRRHRHVDQPATSGVASGQFQDISEANESFLNLLGYTRQALAEGSMNWPDLTPAEYSDGDERAHEEALRFGACAPYEKELIGKDGTRVPVQITTAILKLCPLSWVTLVRDLRTRNQFENIGDGPLEAEEDFKEMVGISAALKRTMGHIEVVAPTDATVLILGETGTGKELVARAIHRLSPRKDMPCITLNCAAIPTGLLESELFGYERGAFTGALSQKMGRFELANRGTLFLDEVGDIPLDLQPKLLRALQEKSFERLGGTRTIPIDVRLVAATNRNLSQMMGDKLFRSDLYYRLKVFPITPFPRCATVPKTYPFWPAISPKNTRRK